MTALGVLAIALQALGAGAFVGGIIGARYSIAAGVAAAGAVMFLCGVVVIEA